MCVKERGRGGASAGPVEGERQDDGDEHALLPESAAHAGGAVALHALVEHAQVLRAASRAHQVAVRHVLRTYAREGKGWGGVGGGKGGKRDMASRPGGLDGRRAATCPSHLTAALGGG